MQLRTHGRATDTFTEHSASVIPVHEAPWTDTWKCMNAKYNNSVIITIYHMRTISQTLQFLQKQHIISVH